MKSKTSGRDTQRGSITGGSGFLGPTLAHPLVSAAQPVLLFDNLARPGVEQNLRWLHDTHGELVDVVIADVRDAPAVRDAVRQCSQVCHFAAELAVPTRLTDPVEDFEVNARGTLNLLEAIRAQASP